MRPIIASFLILSSVHCFSQVRIYSGYIDKYPVQLVTYSYSDGVTYGIYAYDRYDTPIVINGRHKNDSLFLSEINETGEAKLEFSEFTSENNELNGRWISSDKQTVYNIKLKKLREFDSYDTTSFDVIEFMQPESTKENYFKLLISKEKGETIIVTGVRIYEKKTDRLLQEIDLDCQFWGLNNIAVSDYNFDGFEDFSVFETSYAGPNTSSIYILKDPETKSFFISEISGISLEFDAGSEQIYEHNQCCAGRSHMYAVYRLENNKMILIEQSCMEYDDETEDFIEKECE